MDGGAGAYNAIDENNSNRHNPAVVTSKRNKASRRTEKTQWNPRMELEASTKNQKGKSRNDEEKNAGI